jgi:DNA-binding CsgD family transcriptional regulator
MHEKLPSPIRVMLRRLGDSANGRFGEPPHMQIATAYGIVTLEAKWLMPANAIPADVAKDPKSCLVAVTIELREHAVAHAARVLRESGATPAQVKVGIGLALGKTKLAIAGELGLRPSTVEAQTKNLYRTLDIHHCAELGTKIWLKGKSDKTRQPREPGSAIVTNGAFFHRGRTSAGLR